VVSFQGYSKVSRNITLTAEKSLLDLGTIYIDKKNTLLEEVVVEAAGNEEYGTEIIRVLLEQRRDEIGVTDKVIERAMENEETGSQILTLFRDEMGWQSPISED